MRLGPNGRPRDGKAEDQKRRPHHLGAGADLLLFAEIIVISVLTVALYYAVEIAERYFIFWPQCQGTAPA